MKNEIENNEAADMVESHPFGKFGPAPYRFVGVWSMPSTTLRDANPSAYNNAIAEAPVQHVGACMHCGTGIVDHYIVSDGEGHHFTVGSSCINKVHKETGMITRIARDAKLAKNKLNREKAAAKAEVVKAEIESIMADDSFKAKMQSLPHPRGFKSFDTGEPLTAWDNVEWMFSNSGAAGRARLLKSLKAAM